MLKIELLFNENKEVSNIKFPIKNKRIVFRLCRPTIDGMGILQLIKGVNAIENKFSLKIPVVVELGEITFADKLSIVIFECICFYMINYCKRIVYLKYKIHEYDIWTEGVASSPFLLLGTANKDHIKKFVQKFKYDIFRNHFRKVIQATDDEMALSRLMTDIEYFLKIFSVDTLYIDKISEVIAELVGNANEHTKTDTLLDIDVTKSYIKRPTGDNVYGINIVVINFSSQLFGAALHEKLCSSNIDKIKQNKRYNELLTAYNNHKDFFNEDYKKEDFYNIASFQHKISGRENILDYGGTGLTKLIESLEKMSEAHHCYMLTGNRVINFLSEHLEYNEDKWIGFNNKKDFINNIPSNEVVDSCPVFFPGTAYNLNFVMKGACG